MNATSTAESLAAADTAAQTVWREPAPATLEELALASQLDSPPWLAQLLTQRGVADATAADRFLRPQASHLHSPFLMAGMATAVERILQALRLRQPMMIYGDYDVDGTVATVLLKTAIDRLAPTGEPSLVRYHIPHRIREGYGMRDGVLASAAAEGVRLVISVDTGIRAFAAAREAKRLGMDLIVTDHHLPDAETGLPDAVAVVHPSQPGCGYPYKDLCGAAVACKLAEALLRQAAGMSAGQRGGLREISVEVIDAKLLPSFLKLLAIATIADAVPLTDENRTIVSLGLASLQEPRQHGLRVLMRLAGVLVEETGHPLSATDVAFRIAPRINAAGRMDVADDVVRLLLTRDRDEAETLADKLHRLNEERRSTEARVLEQILQQVEALRSAGDGNLACGCLVLDGEGWHRGVVGIAASRVVDATSLPALVIAHEEGVAHGSGRSIDGFHLLDALTAVHSDAGGRLFDRFGGHAFAAGFSLPSERVPELRHRLVAHTAARAGVRPQRTTVLDAELPLAQVTREALMHVCSLEPFGQGNREPVFLARDVVLCEEPRSLRNGHMKLRLRSSSDEGPRGVYCLAWSRRFQWGERLSALGAGAGFRADIAYRLRENRHPQFGGPELELCDIRASADRNSHDS